MLELTYEFPRAIDNTMRTAWDACQRKFLLSHIYNLRKADPSKHLVFGGAFAKGLEVARLEYYAHGNRDKANYLGKACLAAIEEWNTEMDDPLIDEAKSLPNCLGALLYYFEIYPFENDWLAPLTYGDGEASVEFTFALPLHHTHPNGDPMLYTGRFDMLAEFQGSPAVEDDKTATQLGKSWVDGWDLDSQITGYIWAAQQSGIRTTTGLIRGVSILKYNFGHAQAIQHRTKWHIENWHNVLHRNLRDMLDTFATGSPEAFLPSYGQACKAYGGCPYRNLCDKPNWEEWIEPEFRHYVWDPLAIAGAKDEPSNV